MTVPVVLDRWLPYLEAFGTETRTALGPWLGPLAGIVGPSVERRIPDAAPPHGWSGLTNRGPYERLLMSEWLLADELPDEFLRRATSGEHLFVEIERTAVVASDWTAVLFDAGPEQLGAPRLVQLALLVVLAARAGDRRLTVGVLQGEDLIEPVLSPEVGRTLGAARTRRAPGPTDAERWAERLADEGTAPELWVVGGSGTLALSFERAKRVVIHEEWRTGGLRVERRTEGSRAEITLAPPAPSAGAILHDPFSGAAAVGAAEHVSATFGVSQWLFLRVRRAGQDGMVALASPERAKARARVVVTRVVPGWWLFAAGRARGSAVSVWVRDGELLSDGPSGERRMAQPVGLVAHPDGPLSPLFVSRHLMVLPDHGGRLWQLDFVAGEARPLGRYEGLLWFTPPGPIWFEPPDQMHLWRDGSVRRVAEAKLPWTPWVDGEGLAHVPGQPQELFRRRGRWEPAHLPVAGVWTDPAWFPGPQVFAGILTDQLHLFTVAPAPEDRGVFVNLRMIELGPEPVVFARPDPGGRSYVVVTATHVRFFDPATGDLFVTWVVE